MSEPIPPTNLTEKFAALSQQLATQHGVVLDAIAQLRGVGPENTLKSVNESIWNLAGTAPGASLLDLLDKLTRINNGIGGYPDGVVLPGGLQNLSARQLLSQINGSTMLLEEILSATGYSGNETLLQVLKLLLNQFDVSFVTPTMKDLLSTISAQQAALVANTTNPMTVLPSDMCANPITSAGVYFVAMGLSIGAFSFGNPATVATWTTPPLPFYLTDDPGTGSFGIAVDDWSNYKIWVSSTATNFGVLVNAAQRFDTNQWITLSGNDPFRFYVDGEDDIKVYICGVSAPPANPNTTQNEDPGSCSIATERYSGRATAYSVIDTFEDSGTAYNVYAPVMPTVSGLLINYDAANGIARLDPNFVSTYPNGWVVVCVSWDFTGNNVWPFYWRALGDIGSASFFTGTPSTSMNMVGSLMTEMFSAPISGSQEYIAMHFAAPAALGMPANVFIHVSANSSVGHPLP
jgi:hypothetical protein